MRVTPAQIDQEHLRVVIRADPTVSDRHAAAQRNGDSPVPRLARGIHQLTDAGSTIIVSPCNTAHAFLPEAIRTALGVSDRIKFISIIDTAVAAATSRTGAPGIGLLTADAKRMLGLYVQVLQNVRRKPISISEGSQQILMEIIARVKAGTASQNEYSKLSELIDELQNRGAQTIIAGCTAMSALLSLSIVGPSIELARATVAYAGESDSLTWR